jgi:ABC-type bacteriocin/lantibiotic exporter with double-glycine peptidase domain
VFSPIPEKPNNFVKTLESFLPVFGVLAAVLAVRLFLLLAVVGAFILAQTALVSNDTHSLWVLVVYCGFTILPLVWLDAYGRSKRRNEG